MITVGGASITSKGNKITLTADRAVVTQGCKFRTDSSRVVVDWAMGLHGALDGHSPTWWREALYSLSVNNAASVPSNMERIASDKLQEFYPDCDSVRWFSDGSNPNEAAVRLARAITGRKVIAFQGYHGYGTSFPHNPDANDLGVDERRGIPEEMWKLTRQFEWCDFDAVSKLTPAVAAIIVEVPPEDENAKKFLDHCWMQSRKIGALFVIDEVVTGFRVAIGGVPMHYGVKADLYCLGKALGNGFNVSALVGKNGVMDYLTKGVHYSATYNGNGLATGIANATMEWILDNKQRLYPKLYQNGNLLKNKVNQVFIDAGVNTRMVGNATRPVIVNYSNVFAEEFRKRMYQKGYYVMMHPWYLTTKHTEEIIDLTAGAAYDTLKEMKNENIF